MKLVLQNQKVKMDKKDRRDDMRKQRIKNQGLLAMVFVVLGFLVAYQYRQVEAPPKTFTLQELQEVQSELEALREEKDRLITQNQGLAEQVKNYESAAASSSEMHRLLKEELDYSRILLGLVDVKGPGVILTLRPSDVQLQPQTYQYLTELELVYIINELKFAGAEAVSINDKRISIQSALKSSSGNSFILINDEKVSPVEEITIKAIGDPEKLGAAMAFQGALSYYALEQYDIRIQQVSELTIGKYDKAFQSDHMIEEAKP